MLEPSTSGPTDVERPYPWRVTRKLEFAELPDLPLHSDGDIPGGCGATNLRELDPPEIDVCHVPPDHLPPTDEPHLESDAHSDFRFFYEFLRDTDDLRRRLPEDGLPIPRTSTPLTEAQKRKIREETPTSHDCLPAVGEEEEAE
jgi:hypothetical protein